MNDHRFQLKQFEDGSRQLVVWYCGNDYDAAIRQARKQLGQQVDKVSVIAKPVASKRQGGLKP